MAIVKIQPVRDLKATVKYTTQDYKTKEHLISFNECNLLNLESKFELVTKRYNDMKKKDVKTKARMIIQSFDVSDKLTPEQAHKLGVELADNYLKGNHQYLVVTHVETDNLHNHIIFNNLDHNNLKMFDSKRQHTINDLRKENDLIAIQNGLDIVEATHNKGITFNEYVARAKKTSFKGDMEKIIDKNIEKANTFEDFLKLMQEQGYEHKQGKYLSFKNPKSGKYMRTKSLGMNYLEQSLKYRIENKDYVPLKLDIIDKQWIDKSQDKFKDNKGLQKWATKQNIQFLNQLNSKMYETGMTLDEIDKQEQNITSLYESFEKQIVKYDDEIFKLKNMMDSFKIYEDSHSLIMDYKASEDKQGFKSENYTRFKQYDMAKRNINILKKQGITDTQGLKYKISLLEEDRNIMYASVDESKERRKEIEQQQQAKKQAQEREEKKERNNEVSR